MSNHSPQPAIQDLSRFRVPPNFRGASAITVQLWWITQALLFHTSPQFLYSWRRALLRLFGAKIGRGVIIRPSVRVTYPWKLEIGDYSWIGDSVELYNLGNIRIGNHCVVSQYSYLCTGSHDFRSTTFDIFSKDITVLDEAWIAAGVFVHPGVTIGNGSVVGARSILSTDTEPMGIYVGQPATKIGVRTSRALSQTQP